MQAGPPPFSRAAHVAIEPTRRQRRRWGALERRLTRTGCEELALEVGDERLGYEQEIRLIQLDLDGILRHTYSLLGVDTYRQVATSKLPTGDVYVEMLFESTENKPGSGGHVTLSINDEEVGEGDMPRTVPVTFTSYAGMDIGRDNGGSSIPPTRTKLRTHLRHRQEGGLRPEAGHPRRGEGLTGPRRSPGGRRRRRRIGARDFEVGWFKRLLEGNE